MNITSAEFYRNIKNKPTKDSQEYQDFYDKEWDKVEYGVTVNGYFFSGWLYWHLNHWNIEQDIIDERNGKTKRAFQNPILRDNEIIIADALTRAEKEKKGLMIFGSRRISKTVFISSYISRSATIYKGSENVITSGNKDDIIGIATLCDKGLLALHDEFQFGRIKTDWDKEVILGVKDKAGNRKVWSQIIMRNFDGGTKTEAVAGTTPSTFIFDEIGKLDWLPCFQAAIPAFDSEFGWRACPILTGTAGDINHIKDAEEVFTNPEAYNFLTVETLSDNRKIGLFFPGKYSLSVPKIESNMADFLNLEGKARKDLEDIQIKVTPDDGQEIIRKNIIEPALKSNDSASYLKMKMYYPETVDDCFVADTGNMFPIEAAKQQLIYLNVNNIEPECVYLYRDNSNKIKLKHTLDRPITEFPVKPSTNKKAPIQIWERPIDNPPYGLYVLGADPYNQSESKYSESLGSVVVYKRQSDISGYGIHDEIVASYHARPATMNEWHENIEMLIEYYNGICFPENEASTFIQYFDQKNKGHLLADGLQFLKEINPTTSTVGRIKGAAATPKNIAHMMAVLLEYCKEEITVGLHEDGTPVKRLGVSRIKDKMLLTQIIAYKKGLNVDVIVAFRHALAYAKHLDKSIPIVQINRKSEEKERPIIHSPFIMDSRFKSGSLFL